MQRLGADRRRDDQGSRMPAPAHRQGEEDQRTYTAWRHQDQGGDLEKRVVTARQGTTLRLHRNLAIASAVPLSTVAPQQHRYAAIAYHKVLCIYEKQREADQHPATRRMYAHNRGRLINTRPPEECTRIGCINKKVIYERQEASKEMEPHGGQPPWVANLLSCLCLFVLSFFV
jgi:hypothetical protein